MPIQNTPTVNKDELATRIVNRLIATGTTYASHAAIVHVIDAMAAEVKAALFNGENVLLLGLGTLTLSIRKERAGINPITRAPLTVKAMFRIKLKNSAPMKKALALKMAGALPPR